jgi:hypothetical protein
MMNNRVMYIYINVFEQHEEQQSNAVDNLLIVIFVKWSVDLMCCL